MTAVLVTACSDSASLPRRRAVYDMGFNRRPLWCLRPCLRPPDVRPAISPDRHVIGPARYPSQHGRAGNMDHLRDGERRRHAVGRCARRATMDRTARHRCGNRKPFPVASDILQIIGRDCDRFIGWALVMGLAGSWFATWCWVVASRRLPLALSAQLIVAETVFGLVYGFIFEGRWPTVAEATGVMLHFAGVCSAIALFSKPRSSGQMSQKSVASIKLLRHVTTW